MGLSVDMDGVSGSMILDTGSDVSLVQPGLVRGAVETSPLKPYGVTRETFVVLGQQTVCFTIGKIEFKHTFLVCSLPTEASGILGTDFLKRVRAKIDFEKGLVSWRDHERNNRNVEDTSDQKSALFSPEVKMDAAPCYVMKGSRRRSKS
jgi:hypothetical protein